MRINHNIAALNTNRQLANNTSMTNKSLEKLSSGLRINRAGDDAAGLAISEKMRGQIRGLDQAGRNAQDGISMIQTAEGALNETQSILQRMRELSVQASNDTNTSSDRAEMQKENDQLVLEITRISTDTEFNTKKVLDGTLGTKVDASTAASTVLSTVGVASVSYNGGLAAGTWTLTKGTGIGPDAAVGAYKLTSGATSFNSDVVANGAAGTINFGGNLSIGVNDAYTTDVLDAKKIEITGTAALFQIGANAGQTTSISISNMSATALGVSSLVLSTQSGANSALAKVDTALTMVSSERGKLGGMQNRLEHTINNLGTTSENLSASESRIRDVDMAKEMMEFTKNNILTQAAQAMLAQANQQPQGVLQLLR